MGKGGRKSTSRSRRRDSSARTWRNKRVRIALCCNRDRRQQQTNLLELLQNCLALAELSQANPRLSLAELGLGVVLVDFEGLLGALERTLELLVLELDAAVFVPGQSLDRKRRGGWRTGTHADMLR